MPPEENTGWLLLFSTILWVKSGGGRREIDKLWLRECCSILRDRLFFKEVLISLIPDFKSNRILRSYDVD